MAEHRRASTVCARALEETPPRTALWDARPQSAPPQPPPPTTPATPVRHPDESEDDFRARLETVRQLRDRLETDDRMNLACECAKRGVAFDGDDSAAMLRRRLAQDQLPRTYASASARKQSRAARRKAQRKANRALGRLSSGPLMDEIRAAKLSKLSHAAAAPTTPRALRTAGRPTSSPRGRRRARPAGDAAQARRPSMPSTRPGGGPGARARGDAAPRRRRARDC